MPNTFPKHNKLCGQERIAALYKEGKRFTAWPLRVTYLPIETDTQILVWAPKSLFKRVKNLFSKDNLTDQIADKLTAMFRNLKKDHENGVQTEVEVKIESENEQEN